MNVTKDQWDDLVSQFTVVQFALHLLWIREFERSGDPLKEATDFAAHLTERLDSGPPQDRSEDLTHDLKAFFEQIVSDLQPRKRLS